MKHELKWVKLEVASILSMWWKKKKNSFMNLGFGFDNIEMVQRWSSNANLYSLYLGGLTYLNSYKCIF